MGYETLVRRSILDVRIGAQVVGNRSLNIIRVSDTEDGISKNFSSEH